MDEDPLPNVCILAGGLGTRLSAKTQGTPKSLAILAGEPFVFHQLRLLAHAGASTVTLCVGHLGEMIEHAVGKRQFGLSISYSYDEPGLGGTLGAIRGALPLLGDHFFVLYGDCFLPIDYQDVALRWNASKLFGLMTVYRNEHGEEASNADFDSSLIRKYDKKNPDPRMQWIDYGLGGLRTSAFDEFSVRSRDIADFYALLARNHQLFGYESPYPPHEIGTPESLHETDRFIRSLA
jgi:NDP-sugar pyrophosphorylase family protein